MPVLADGGRRRPDNHQETLRDDAAHARTEGSHGSDSGDAAPDDVREALPLSRSRGGLADPPFERNVRHMRPQVSRVTA